MRRALEQDVKKQKRKIKKKSKFKFKIHLNKKTRLVIVGVVIVTICAILVSNYTYFGLVFNKNITAKDTIKVELPTSNNDIYPYKNGVLIYSSGNLSFYNKNGNLKWKVSIEDTLNADIKIAGEYIQVINKDKSIIFIYKNKYEVARIKLKEDILSANINMAGITAVEYKPNGTKRAIGIYDNNGRQKYDIKVNSGMIGKYVLSDNSRYLAYVDVDISGISAYTKVNIIDLNNTDKENYKTIFSEGNSLVYDLYWYGKKVIIRTDEKFSVYNVSTNKSDTVSITDNTYENIEAYDLKYAYIKFGEESGYYLTFSKILSKEEKDTSIKEVPKYFFYNNGLAYLCYSKSIEVYNNFGMKIKEYSSDTIITKPVIFNEGKSVALMISNTILMFSI